MNKKLLGAIEEAIKGLNMVAEAIKAEGAEADETSAPAKRTPAGRKASEKKAPAKSAPAKKTADEDEDSAGEYTYDELMDMPYNDMKKYAKSVGVTAMGSREKIVNDILKTYGVEAPDEEDEDEDEAPKKKAPASKKAPAGKKTPASKKSAPVEEDEEDEEEDEVTAQVNEAVKDMEDSEIAELLKQAGLPSKGKRTALIARVIKGVKDEVIDLDGEEDEDEDGDEESIYDSLNDYENNEEIPEERAAAIKKFEAATNKKVKAKTLKMAMIKKALTAYYGDEADLSEAGDEELVEAYIDMKCRFIDDEGDNYDGTDDAYYVNGMLACHGYICEESEDGSSLVCPVCGAEYENEAE